MKNIYPFGFHAVIIISFISLTIAKNKTKLRCTTPDSRSGSCIQLDQCTLLVNLMQKKTQTLTDSDKTFLQRSQCGFSDGKVFVCCPRQQRTNTPRKNRETNTENWITDDTYRELKLQAKLPEPDACKSPIGNRIFGGTDAEIDQHPWMALIEYNDGGSRNEHNCGGSLINERYVLTAAHCIKSIPKTWTPTRVRLGEWNTSTDPDCSGTGRNKKCADPHIDVTIEKAITHEKYEVSSRSQHNDIGLLRLSRNIVYTDYIKPICLPLAEHLKGSAIEKFEMYVSGWGKTKEFKRSNVKQIAQVPVIALSDCRNVFRPPVYDVRNSQICAGGQEGIDSCNGDSGGSLIGIDTSNANQSYYFMAGIISIGRDPCGNKGWPGVYTRVNNYIDWIQENIES